MQGQTILPGTRRNFGSRYLREPGLVIDGEEKHWLRAIPGCSTEGPLAGNENP